MTFRQMKTSKQHILGLYTGLDRGRFELVRSMMSEDFITHLVRMSVTLDRSAFILFGLEFRQAFPAGCHQFDADLCNYVYSMGNYNPNDWNMKGYNRCEKSNL